MAFNEGVLRDSLSSLRGQPFTPAPLPPVEGADVVHCRGWQWGRVLPVPAGWTLEPGRPAPCPGLAEPRTAVTASPAQDAGIALRAAVWAGGVTPEAAAPRMLLAPGHGRPGLLLHDGELAWHLLSDRGDVRAGRVGTGHAAGSPGDRSAKYVREGIAGDLAETGRRVSDIAQLDG